MTSLTKRVLTGVYNMTESDFDFQLMYMPMNSNVFRNDTFAEVCSIIAPLSLYAIIQLGGNII